MCDMEYCFQIEFAAALLKQVFQRLAEQVHDHYVKHLAVVSFLIAHKVQEGHKSLASHLVDEFALPKKHNVPLHFDCFFLIGYAGPLTTLAARYSPVFFFSTI